MNGQGKLGEEYAVLFLERKGYTILCRNYTVRGGELDIVAADGHFLVFAEVKLRGEGAMYGPLEAVTKAKQKRLVKTALLYLQRHPSGLQPRFDVLGLTVKDGEVVSVEHIENAFPGGGYF